ncbi:MAG TPA: hypothetical protein VJX94_21190 [Stellaceae bacterium]|nr:hypothetical protein [Stellaceae bacterium]
MKKLLIYALPVALMATQAAGAPPSGWGGMVTRDLGAATAGTDAAPLVLVQHRGGGHVNRANVNRTNVNRTNVNRTSFNSNNFHRDVSVNRNVVVSGGHYGPNWGGIAAGAAVGASVTAAASAAAYSNSYPPPPPYPYYPDGYGY